MPLYDFIDTETSEVFSKTLSLYEREEFLKSNPHIKQTLCAPSIGDSVRLGVKRVDESFKDILRHAKKSHRGSTIKTR